MRWAKFSWIRERLVEGQLDMEQWTKFRHDIRRYKRLSPDRSLIGLLGFHQGLWALLQYRAARAVYESATPRLLKKPMLAGLVMWQKLVEVLTGISISYKTDIGSGLYIGHFGNIFIHPQAIIGANCNISQGVTIGISGQGQARGVPILGSRVYVGVNAVVAGKIKIGDGAVIAANALVIRDIPPNVLAIGNPAQIVKSSGLGEYIDS